MYNFEFFIRTCRQSSGNYPRILNEDERKQVGKKIEEWSDMYDSMWCNNAIIIFIKDENGIFIPVGMQQFFIELKNIGELIPLKRHDPKEEEKSIRNILRNNFMHFKNKEIIEEFYNYNKINIIAKNNVRASGIFIDKKWRRKGIGLFLRSKTIEYLKHYYQTFSIHDPEDTNEAYNFHNKWLKMINKYAIHYPDEDADFSGVIIKLDEL